MIYDICSLVILLSTRMEVLSRKFLVAIKFCCCCSLNKFRVLNRQWKMLAKCYLNMDYRASSFSLYYREHWGSSFSFNLNYTWDYGFFFLLEIMVYYFILAIQQQIILKDSFADFFLLRTVYIFYGETY